MTEMNLDCVEHKKHNQLRINLCRAHSEGRLRLYSLNTGSNHCILRAKIHIILAVEKKVLNVSCYAGHICSIVLSRRASGATREKGECDQPRSIRQMT